MYFNKSYMNVFYLCLSQNISLYYMHGTVMQTKRCFMSWVGWRETARDFIALLLRATHNFKFMNCSFLNFLYNIFGPQLTAGNWNHKKQNPGLRKADCTCFTTWAVSHGDVAKAGLGPHCLFSKISYHLTQGHKPTSSPRHGLRNYCFIQNALYGR